MVVTASAAKKSLLWRVAEMNPKLLSRETRDFAHRNDLLCVGNDRRRLILPCDEMIMSVRENSGGLVSMRNNFQEAVSCRKEPPGHLAE